MGLRLPCIYLFAGYISLINDGGMIVAAFINTCIHLSGGQQSILQDVLRQAAASCSARTVFQTRTAENVMGGALRAAAAMWGPNILCACYLPPLPSSSLTSETSCLSVSPCALFSRTQDGAKGSEVPTTSQKTASPSLSVLLSL